MAKFTLIALLSLLLLGCSTRDTTPTKSLLLSEQLKIVTYSQDKTALSTQLQKSHGKNLAVNLQVLQKFGSVEYLGSERDVSSEKTTLRVTFLYAIQKKGGWPLEIKAHYILNNGEETLLNQVYQVEAINKNDSPNCKNCSPSAVALSLLLNKVLPELKQALIEQV